MKNSQVFYLALTILAAIAVTLGATKDKFTTKYDKVNIKEILENERLFNNYYRCLMDQGPCTPDGTELKNAIPDALANDCDKCSEIQQENTKLVLKFLIETKKEEFDELEKKFDPKGEYRTRYHEKAAKEGIAV